MDIQLLRRRQLRRESTDAEAALWARLRGRRLAGFKFRRQHPCGIYILDFFCAERRLAIEIDGGQHFEATVAAYDARRTRYLASCDIVVLRVASDRVLLQTEAVVLTIAAALGLEWTSLVG